MATRREHRTHPARSRAGLVGLLLVVALGAGAGLLAAAVRPPWQLRYTDPNQSVPEVTAVSTWQPSEFPTAQPTDQDSGGFAYSTKSIFLDTLIYLLITLAVLVVVAVVVVLVRRRRSRLATADPVETLPADVAEPQIPVLQRGADEATRRLLGDGPPTDAIIAAWLALEEAAASSGTARSPAQTPTEFTAAVLRETGVQHEPVETLLRLYLRARFSADGARPDDLEVARRCVHDLSDAWRSYRLQSVPRP